MGFRFRRSVKLAPGIRLNLGKRGASLSLGGRGATLNVSSRGMRTTLGIPGTGLSWSQSSATTQTRAAAPRAQTTRAYLALLRAQAKEEERRARIAEATEQVASHERGLRDVMSSWREMDDVVPKSMFEDALEEIPFEEPEGLEAPIESQVAVALRLELLRKARSPTDVRSVIACVASLLGSVALFALDAQLACAAVGIVPLSVWLVTRERAHTQIDEAVALAAAATFPQRWQEVLAVHARELASRQSERDAAWSKWSKEEQERIAWLRSLIAGHPGAVEETLSETLSDLDFPFETSCRVAVPTSEDAYVLLDLPEIEDVVPELKPKILKSGVVKMVKRTSPERHEDYAHLAAGLALMVGRTALNASPTLQRIHIAAFTQRRNSRTGQVLDDYVYEAGLERSALEEMNPAAVDPLAFIVESRGRLVRTSNGLLKKITEPEWLDSEQFGSDDERDDA